MFAFIFKARSLYWGHDAQRFNEIRDILDTNGIAHKVKVRSLKDRAQGMGGNLGLNHDLETDYEILVKKSDYEKSSNLICK